MTFTTDLHKGERMRIVKFLAYGWSSRRSVPAMRDQTDAALAAVMHTGWDELVRSQRAYLDEFWAGADVELDGDPALQQAMRFALFSVLQSAARAEGRAIPAKGLTGRGYDGHSFWDMETYTLPMLTYVAPTAARDALLWRHSTLDMARARAQRAAHRRGDVPLAHDLRQGVLGLLARRHGRVSHQRRHRRRRAALHRRHRRHERSRRGEAIELLVETARLWRSIGHHDVVGNFRIDGVTGPDEYTSIADNNVYTNLMAARNMRTAADLCAHHGKRAAELGVDEEEIAAWRDAAARDGHPVRRGARRHAAVRAVHALPPLGLRRTRRPEHYPLLLHYPYYKLYSSQVIKQADLVFALYACGDQLQRRAEGARLRVLRGDHRARLVAVGVRAGDRRGGGRPRRPRLRLPRRDRLHRPARPRLQHEGRHPPRRAGGHVARRGRRLRRDARPRRHGCGSRRACPPRSRG